MTVIETRDSTPDRLVVETVIDAPPNRVWRAFVDANDLGTWWAQEAEVEPHVGGTILARWPAMDWTMRGTYTELEAPTVVAFTWTWDHEPDTPERLVRITLVRAGGGTHLTLSHGEYGPSDALERTGHLDGWRHFLSELNGYVTSR